jgi:hypothetical protein
MQAMNGRKRGRGLIGCMIALFALSAMIMPSIASAKKTPPPPVTTNYLAMGDSLAFGYSKQLYNEAESKGDPSQAFENGYTTAYWKKLKGEANGIGLINNGCPGETTESLIGNNPALIGAINNFVLKSAIEKGEAVPATGESPCEYGYAWSAFKTNGKGGPLHNEYGPGHSTFEIKGTPVLSNVASQLENTLGEIAGQAAAGKPVETISLNIGANDNLHAIAKCEAQAKKEVEEKIGKGELAFEEPLVKETGEKLAKECIAAAVPGLFAQINSNLIGILALIRNAGSFGIGVNYTGKIILNSSYNPFGNVFGTGELLAGTNELNGLGNQLQRQSGEKFGACDVAKIQTAFNPQNKNEPKLLQRFTNMNNFTSFEGKPNGPDIHPRPAGYNKIGTLMFKECG